MKGMACLAEEHLLSVRLQHRQGSLRLRVTFRLVAPWTVIFGPSGSGKSTVLRAIAGFLQPDEGSVVFGTTEKVLLSTAEGVSLAPHLRPTRSAGQTARLFPGMRVRENAAYGLGWKAGSKEHADDVHKVLDEVLGLFRLGMLAERWPKDLSGGERQRVSVARAVVSAVTFNGPGRALLLLDEPFAGLDVVLRDDLAMELRLFLERWMVPVLSVSHDIAEAFLLGAEVIRMAEGQIVDQGPVEVVLRGERERLLAGLQR
jgi:molybdate transport system ATP-binding protein